MSEINLKRFVDINIQTDVNRVLSGTRDTVVLFTGEGTASTVREISSLAEANTYYTSQAAPTTRAYLTVFFNNGGVKCKVIEGVAYTALTADMITALKNEEILVACAIPDANREAGYSAIKTLAQTRASSAEIYGINEKILLARTNVNTDTSSIKNFGVKFSNVLGAEMTIAAYLTQIDVYKADTVHDYSYTSESISYEDLTDANFATIQDNNMNVDIYLASASRNLGGNLKDGNDVTNEFVRIVMHQTLTDRLIQLLASKIKSNTGISQIYTTIAQELENYRTCGYLTTDKIWSDDDLIMTYNDHQYVIIESGTALLTGYNIKVLPFSSLTTADKAAHKAPPIYVIIADQYGIRKITITGEVI